MGWLAHLFRGRDYLRGNRWTAAATLGLENVDGGEVAVKLVVVEPVADHEVVRDVEPLVADRHWRDAALLLVQEDTELERRGLVALDMIEQERCRESRVDDVLDHQHVPSADVHGQVFKQLDVSRRLRPGAVAADRDVIEVDGDSNVAAQVRRETDRTLEDREQDERPLEALIIAGNLLGNLADAPLDGIGADQLLS